MKRLLAATIAGALVLIVVQGITAVLLVPVPVELPPDAGPWIVASNLLIAAVLAWIARRSAWTGWRLAAALFAIGFGIGQGVNLIEAWVFRVFRDPAIVPALFLNSFVGYLLFAPLMVALCGRWSRGAAGGPGWPQLSARQWIGLLVALDVLYLLLYYTAGTIIFPYVQSFYEGLTMPSTAAVVLLQLLVRGPVFIAGGLLIVRMTPASRLELALLFAAVMSIVGGAAQLIIPTPFFPDAVRYVHFMEVVPSNFLFGFLTGWLLGGRREGRSAQAVAAPA